MDNVGALIFNSLQMFLILLPHWKAPYWDIPRGKIEEGETPYNTALREIWIKTNITIKAPNVITEYIGKTRYLPKKNLHIFVTFLEEAVEVKCNSEHSRPVDFKWIKWDDRSDYLSPKIQGALNQPKVCKKLDHIYVEK